MYRVSILPLALALAACATPTTTPPTCTVPGICDSTPTPDSVQQIASQSVVDTRAIERAIVNIAKETAKAAAALLKPVTAIADLPIGF